MLQRARDFRILHEPRPDAAAAQVLGAQQRDAEIDADDIGIDPAARRVKRIGEAIPAIDAIAEPLAHLANSGQRDIRRQHQ